MSEETNTQGTTPNAETITIPATLDGLKAMAKEDLLKLKQDAIQFPAVIEQAIAAKVAEEEAEVKEEIQEVAGELITAEKTFVQKYGQAVCHGVEIILLAIIAGRILNLI